MFRTRTVTQAAILAARVGLLTNAPLTKADILVGSSRIPPNRVVTTPNATSMRRLIRMRNIGPDGGISRRRPRRRPTGRGPCHDACGGQVFATMVSTSYWATSAPSCLVTWQSQRTSPWSASARGLISLQVSRTPRVSPG